MAEGGISPLFRRLAEVDGDP